MTHQDLAFLAIGLFLLVAGFILAWRRTTTSAMIFVLSGFSTLIILHPTLQSLDISRDSIKFTKILGREIAQQIGDVSKILSDHTKFLEQQEIINRNNSEILSKISSASEVTKSASISMPNATPQSKKDFYRIFIYYSKGRRDLAYELKDRLLQDGFRTSVLDSDLSEYTDIISRKERKPGWIHIGWANRGKNIINEISDKVSKLDAVKTKNMMRSYGDEWDLDDADIEIILY